MRKEVQGGSTAKEVCREDQISETTCYNWKSQYGGMKANDKRKLKELEDGDLQWGGAQQIVLTSTLV